MEAGFLGAAAAPERQVRPESGEQKRAPAVLISPPVIRARAEYPGVDCGKNLRAAAAAMHSERSCGPGQVDMVRQRALEPTPSPLAGLAV